MVINYFFSSYATFLYFQDFVPIKLCSAYFSPLMIVLSYLGPTGVHCLPPISRLTPPKDSIRTLSFRMGF